MLKKGQMQKINSSNLLFMAIEKMGELDEMAEEGGIIFREIIQKSKQIRPKTKSGKYHNHKANAIEGIYWPEWGMQL
jgi:hypothetical protein